MTIEPRMQWAIEMLRHCPCNELSAEKITDVLLVIEHGADKHRDNIPQSARTHIDHAIRHLNSTKYGPTDDDSRLPHIAHAAARCLLAFGVLSGLVER